MSAVETETRAPARKRETKAQAVPRFGPLWRLLQPIRGRLIIACVIGAVGASASVVPFIAVANLAESLLSPAADSAGAIWTWGLVAVGALLLRFVCVFIAGGITHYSDTGFQLLIRRRMATWLGRVPLGWFTVRTSGSVKKSVSDDVMSMHHLIAHTALEVIDGLIIPLVTMVYLFSIDWRMSMFVTLPLMVGVVLYGAQVAKLRPRIAEYAEAMSDINGSAVEFVQGISVVKTFGQTGKGYRRFLDAAAHFLDLTGPKTRGTMKASALAETVLAPLTSLVIIVAAGAGLAASGALDPVTVIPFVLLGIGVTAPLTTLWLTATATTEAAEAAERVLDILSTPALEVPEAPKTPTDSTVALEQVTFSYDADRTALEDVSLRLEPGTTTALVGRSGSGKTTIAKLIPRFWDPASGRITIGDVDIREIAPTELYRQVSFVFQDVQLLSTTVRDNIRLARPDASAADVENAARAAQIHDRILELPRGFDSVVGDDALFSGGEAQRVSIARAILADTPVLILDEATAFADPESEALIQDALSALTAGRTLLVIAHRLSTVQGADQIVVVDDGQIVERGRHDALLSEEGLYATLWASHERASTWHPTTRQETEVTR
ncbi:ABC transporter ATP-binding protein [Microbacterium marinilacus]|uniref:ABC transporter ATP-binding protein n=1 Tax=Microbacterium marinilacus TaxID=415209 RepID=A0ABP7BT55_9MICO|nr:ABC transporter ATP-binding protein [Microbacterium marinilacus]MBY0690468.1 ABC transporter ATP-binding protein/permease [Microbacterium marinilacus]